MWGIGFAICVSVSAESDTQSTGKAQIRVSVLRVAVVVRELGGELRVEAEFLQLPVNLTSGAFHKLSPMFVAAPMRFQCVQRLRHTLELVLMM